MSSQPKHYGIVVTLVGHSSEPHKILGCEGTGQTGRVTGSVEIMWLNCGLFFLFRRLLPLASALVKPRRNIIDVYYGNSLGGRADAGTMPYLYNRGEFDVDYPVLRPMVFGLAKEEAGLSL
jgi:hypothetical protein